MPCFKCGSKYLHISKTKIRELAKGSPTRGKKVKWVSVECTKVQCLDCQSAEMTYRELS